MCWLTQSQKHCFSACRHWQHAGGSDKSVKLLDTNQRVPGLDAGGGIRRCFERNWRIMPWWLTKQPELPLYGALCLSDCLRYVFIACTASTASLDGHSSRYDSQGHAFCHRHRIPHAQGNDSLPPMLSPPETANLRWWIVPLSAMVPKTKTRPAKAPKFCVVKWLLSVARSNLQNWNSENWFWQFAKFAFKCELEPQSLAN